MDKKKSKRTRNIEILSDGLGKNTYLLIDGRKIDGIKKIEIKPILPGEEVEVLITMSQVKLSLSKLEWNRKNI